MVLEVRIGVVEAGRGLVMLFFELDSGDTGVSTL